MFHPGAPCGLARVDCAHAPVRDTLPHMAKPKAKPVRVSVFLDPALDRKVEQRARQYGWSKSKFVANAIQIYLVPSKEKAA